MHHRETFLLSRLFCTGPIAPQVESPRRMSHRLRHGHRGLDEEWRRDGDQESGDAEEHDLEEFGETLLLALTERGGSGRIRNEEADTRIAPLSFGSFNHFNVCQSRTRL